MKKWILVIYLLFFIFSFSNAQITAFPPELKWWLDEVQKANPNISLDKFMLKNTTSQKIEAIRGYDIASLYPVFKRWNFSGNLFAYYDLGYELIKNKDGKYSISNDIDSYIGIFSNNNELIFSESFGSTKGLNGLGWLKDTVLYSTGIWINSYSEDNPFIDLIIIEYIISKENIIINEYIYKNGISNTDREKLRLNWYEQRKDYFN